MPRLICEQCSRCLIVASDVKFLTWVAFFDRVDGAIVLLSGLAYAQVSHVYGLETTVAITLDPRKFTVTPINNTIPTAIWTRRRAVRSLVEDMGISLLAGVTLQTMSNE
jgi:hypothetical protein